MRRWVNLAESHRENGAATVVRTDTDGGTMPTQNVTPPAFSLRTDGQPTVLTDSSHERAWYPAYGAPASPQQ
ncbi:hypothetical protein GCM10010140_22640 [Streptosporangium pseudovulgare]|uniref:Uncharacterized protein n=1 Tax=Streptosporangium pseudovulgare TaxID=35765 RepID=A0ABQ2QT64_9ACTN|nr:hypothetical protein GCM10010140_22640 [Streptosporangium pseudovulgare]